MKYLLQTFGCKSNQYESQALRELLSRDGFTEVTTLAEASLYIINTCGVTGRAVASCRNALRRAARANPELVFVITGCGVDLNEDWPDLPGGPPIRIPNAKKHAIRDYIGARMHPWITPPEDQPFALSVSGFQGHTRAFLKIQDGCDNCCSYCAVPRARGAPRSRPRREVLDEARRLTAAGYGEVVLTGINIGAYRDGDADLADLVTELADTDGLVRLRLGSVEPPQVTARLVQAMRTSAVCPHIHLPLQSGDDRVLGDMGRRYGTREFLDLTAMIREGLPHPSITTDVIVGFPGEDETAFLATADLCRQAGFSRLHVFLFSPRPGTPAALLKRDTPDRIVEERKAGLLALGERLAADYAAGCVGLRERVIVERPDGRSAGHGDRYLKVYLTEEAREGTIVDVEIVMSDGDALLGQPIASR